MQNWRIKNRIRKHNITENKWLLELNSKPKLRTLKEFKCEFKPEPYIISYLSRYQRSLLAQYRCGILPLRIETGRFNLICDTDSRNIRRLNLEERTCQLCNLNNIEDEFHLTCVCPLYTNFRNNMYQTVNQQNFINFDNHQKFFFLNRNCQNLLGSMECQNKCSI